MRNFRHLSNVATLALDREGCIGCGLCVEVCPHGVFVLEGGRALIADRDGCMECGACALNCPVKVIEVEAGVGCASGMINEWLQGMKIGRRSPGGGCC